MKEDSENRYLLAFLINNTGSNLNVDVSGYYYGLIDYGSFENTYNEILLYDNSNNAICGFRDNINHDSTNAVTLLYYDKFEFDLPN